MTAPRYCIGCTWFDLQPRDDGESGSTLTGQYGEEEPALFCIRGHWRVEMDTSATLETFRRCMEKAGACPDYAERYIP